MTAEPIDPPATGDLATILGLLDRSGVPVALLDHGGVVLQTNEIFARACGRPSRELVGAVMSDVLLADDRAAVQAVIGSTSDGLRSTDDSDDGIEVRIVGADGRVRPMRLHFAVLDSEASHHSVLMCVAHDRTAERRRDRSARSARVRQATADTTDPPTGLLNRKGLDLALSSAGRRAHRHDAPYALIRCEVTTADDEGPTPPNDEVLTACVERIRQRLRPADTVARIDDALLVVAEDLHDEQDAAGVAYRLLSTVVEPVSAGDGAVQLRMVIGLVIAEGSTPPHEVTGSAADAASDAREPGGFRLVDLRRPAG